MPSEQAQYIHRIGRTARAGKQGQAILLLHDFEEFFMQSLKGLPVEQMQPASQQVIVILITYALSCGSIVIDAGRIA